MGHVSIRINSIDNLQATGQIKHDIRVNQPHYLRNKERDNIIYIDGHIISQNDNDEDKISQLYEYLKKVKNKSRQDHIKISEEKTKRRFQFNTKSAIAGIITFSPTMSEDYQKNPELFLEIMKETLAEIEKTLNTNIIYAVIHRDEKVEHIHFMGENFNRETGKTIQRNINRENLSFLQDLSGEKWGVMGYQRGIKKDISGRKYYSVLEGHKKEMEEIEQDLKQQLQNLKDRRLELSKIDMDLIGKKAQYQDITEQQTKIRDDIKTIKSTKQKIAEQIKQDAQVVIDNSKGFMGIDKEKLHEEIKKVLVQYSNIKPQLKELQDVQQEKETLSTQNAKLQDTLMKQKSFVQNTLSENAENTQKIKFQVEMIKTITEDKKQLQDDLNDLVEEVKKNNPSFNYKSFKENRKSIYTKLVEDKNNYMNR
ncbi:MAG: plasmid recombination protein [Sulfurimonas sp.]|uniref:plasmid recombination protein n=1 Tax=Sulfurimonas sp. TaxID=2022749 RepID=UPI002628F767|nr:plasmid recombination protein [Sulfurimonas sp.]MDD5400811.1 plasmid recombination protein [Sulfurimonas sp.]